ncbi:MAG: CRISPR-associated ring nuclease Csm6, partial [Kiritimatiellae bacterium]|nr:CRISPR-associated ring nuclease Csm6 [Kiritimatiellia bacterium]
MDKSNRKVVLIAVVGTSPAVLTETVWALAHEKRPVIPDEVLVITTETGRDNLTKKLLEGEPSVWKSLVKSLKMEGHPVQGRLNFGKAMIKVIPDESGGWASDLRTKGDNMRAADLMLDVVRSKTENPETIVFASIAGGRKSMGALLLSCMSLLGREEDRVNHVLTSPEMIGMKRTDKGLKRGDATEFFYPIRGAAYSKAGSDSERITSSKVKIELFDVPYVRIRGWFQEKFKELPPSYGSLVNAVQRKAPPAELLPIVRLDVSRGLCRIGDSDCSLGGLEFALLYVLAKKVFDRDEQYKIFNRLYGLRQNDLSKLPRWLREFISSARIREDSEGVRPDIYAALTWIGNNLRACLQDRMEASLVKRISPLRGRQGDYPDDRIVI